MTVVLHVGNCSAAVAVVLTDTLETTTAPRAIPLPANTLATGGAQHTWWIRN